MDQPINETQLISNAQQGNLEAFNQLVLIHQDAVFNTAYRILGGYDEAEDVVQKAFISAYQNIRAYRGGSFKAWLMRTTINACYDDLRRSKRHPTVPLEPKTEDDRGLESDSWLPDPSPTPQQVSEMKELQKAVQYCLQQLPADFRAIAVLADVDEMDYEEISRVTGNPLGTVKSRLARSRQKLRGCLEGFWELLPLNIRQKYEGTR